MSDEEVVKFEFDAAFQDKIAALFLRDTQFALRTKELIDPDHFTDQSVGALIAIVKEHVTVHKSTPDLKIIPTLLRDALASKRLRDDMKDDVVNVVRRSMKADLSSSSFVIDKVVDFAKHQAMANAILESVHLLERGDFKGIEAVQKKALAVGSNAESADYDYFKEIENRTKRREDMKAGKIVLDGITSGFFEIDTHLYHAGWGRKELSLIMGAAKAGKSLSLGEFTKNASLAGYNALYASCEVRTDIIADRIDANLSDTVMRVMKDDPHEVERRIKEIEKKSAALKIRDFAIGTLKPSQLHRIIEEYKANGLILDLVTVDYADIMAAEYRTDNQIDNMRSIYTDLRALAYEHNVAMLTATQTNRDGAKAHKATMTDVAEDFNKIRIADIVISINATEDEKKSGEARLFWAASRNTEDGFTLRIRQDREKLKFLTKVLGKE